MLSSRFTTHDNGPDESEHHQGGLASRARKSHGYTRPHTDHLSLSAATGAESFQSMHPPFVTDIDLSVD
jgi:hypothetical protein